MSFPESPVLPKSASNLVDGFYMAAQKILLIDDDPDLRLIVKTVLSKEGYDVKDLPDAMAGLQRIKTREVDLILLDWQMPGMSGVEALRTIRSWDIQTPVIMLTAVCSGDRVLEAKKAGVTDYLIKPFDRKDLLSKVKAALGGKVEEE